MGKINQMKIVSICRWRLIAFNDMVYGTALECFQRIVIASLSQFKVTQHFFFNLVFSSNIWSCAYGHTRAHTIVTITPNMYYTPHAFLLFYIEFDKFWMCNTKIVLDYIDDVQRQFNASQNELCGWHGCVCSKPC